MAQQCSDRVNPKRGPVHREAGEPGAGRVTIDQAAVVVLQLQPPLQPMALQPQTEKLIRKASRRDRAKQLLDLMRQDGLGAKPRSANNRGDAQGSYALGFAVFGSLHCSVLPRNGGRGDDLLGPPREAAAPAGLCPTEGANPVVPCADGLRDCVPDLGVGVA